MTSFLGIDAGNTGVKAVLFDEKGKELARAHRDTGGTSPAPGMVERDVLRLRRDLDALILEVLTKSGRDGGDVAAIGASGHGNGLYLLDNKAEPLAAIQSLDTRASDIVSAWERDGTAERAAAVALQRPWASQTPTLLAWMARNRPETMARAAHVLMCKDLVTLCLTGNIVSDISDMGGAGLLDLASGNYSAELMAAYGLSDQMHLLPALKWSTDIVGGVTTSAASRTGLRAGTPVVAGLFDVISGAIGAGVTQVGQTSLILGTWSINQAIVKAPVPGVFMSCGIMPGRFMAMENSATSAANLEWAVHTMMGEGAFAMADQLAGAAVQHPDAPLYHPYLYGSSTDPAVRGGLFGVGGWHKAADLMRALFEGVAFAHRAHLIKLADAGVALSDLVLSGGGARSPVWPQMIADMLGKSVHIAAQPEAGALGAAMAAAVGAGKFTDFDEAARGMVAAAHSVHPDHSKKPLYDKRFALWSALGESLTPHWQALKSLGND